MRAALELAVHAASRLDLKTASHPGEERKPSVVAAAFGSIQPVSVVPQT